MPSIYDAILFACIVLVAWRKGKYDFRSIRQELFDWTAKPKRRYVRKSKHNPPFIASTITNRAVGFAKPRRKRRTKAEMAAARAEEADNFMKPVPSGPPVVKRKRGRPRKGPVAPQTDEQLAKMAKLEREAQIPAVN